MIFLKNQKKMIALVVVLMFLNVVGISSMPLIASKTKNQIKTLPPAILPVTDGPIKLALLTEQLPLNYDGSVSIAYENSSNLPTQNFQWFAGLLAKTIDDKQPEGSLEDNDGNVILAAATRSDKVDKTVEIRFIVKAENLISTSGLVEVQGSTLAQLVTVFCSMQGIKLTGTGEIKMALFDVKPSDASPYTQISNLIIIPINLD